MHRAKGDRFVRASELPVCNNGKQLAGKQYLQILENIKGEQLLPDSELDEVVELVDVLHSLMLLSCRTLYCPSNKLSNLLCKNLCSRRNCSLCEFVFLSLSSKT